MSCWISLWAIFVPDGVTRWSKSQRRHVALLGRQRLDRAAPDGRPRPDRLRLSPASVSARSASEPFDALIVPESLHHELEVRCLDA